jgi:hypothetical protein
MATSGIIGQTRISAIKLIEKALRRCGVSPSLATAEILDTAREDLFMLLMSMLNRGLNLWCVDRQEIPIVANQATYPLPVGTIQVLDLLYARASETGITEIPLTPISRNSYAQLPKKDSLGQPTSYWFEKLVDPQVTLWPVPYDDTAVLNLYRHRQMQDVGDLSNELELPSRWLESICWQLALRLAFELPQVSAERMQAIQGMSTAMTIEVEGGETDDSPVYFAPNIKVYTR